MIYQLTYNPESASEHQLYSYRALILFIIGHHLYYCQEKRAGVYHLGKPTPFALSSSVIVKFPTTTKANIRKMVGSGESRIPLNCFFHTI